MLALYQVLIARNITIQGLCTQSGREKAENNLTKLQYDVIQLYRLRLTITLIIVMRSVNCLRRGFSVATRLVLGDACTKRISKTAEEVARVAGVTLGPMGRNVCIQGPKSEPRITKDGVTVVKHIEYEDRLDDAICTLIKKSVNGTNKYAGDGTTTSCLLIAQILKQGRRRVETGENVRQIKLGLQKGRDIAIEFLRAVAEPIKTEQEYRRVAMIATKQDRHLSSLITKAVTGCDLIKVERGSGVESYVEFYKGVKMVAGINHPDFKNKGDKVQLDYPLVLLSPRPINSIQEIMTVLELAKKARKQLLVVSSKISDSVLSTFIYNKRKNVVQAIPLILHEHGTVPREYYRQLVKATGAKLYDEYAPPLSQATFEDLGRAVRVDMDQLESTVLGHSKEGSSNAVIYSGGPTQAVALEVHDKLIDALNSVQTAKKKGVVPGGGITYWRIADLLEQYEGQGEVGVKVLAKALRVPRAKLVEGIADSYRAMGGSDWEAWDFKEAKLKDMREAGVIDSAAVGESVLVDAVSVCSMLLDVQACLVRVTPNTDRMKDIDALQDSLRI